MTTQDKATSRAESGGAREIIEHCASLAVSYMQDLPSWDGTASDCGYLRNAIVNGDHSALASRPADPPSGDALKSMESMMRPETVVQAKKEAAEILAESAEPPSGVESGEAVYVVLSRGPGPDGDFVELETKAGKSVGGVPWEHKADGLWYLGPLFLASRPAESAKMVPMDRHCPSCGGQGYVDTSPGYDRETCTFCEGSGIDPQYESTVTEGKKVREREAMLDEGQMRVWLKLSPSEAAAEIERYGRGIHEWWKALYERDRAAMVDQLAAKRERASEAEAEAKALREWGDRVESMLIEANEMVGYEARDSKDRAMVSDWKRRYRRYRKARAGSGKEE